MSRFWTLLSNLHSLVGPVVTLLYPLYASVIAIETPGKDDDEQWLAYWILYSLLTLTEMLLQSVLEWIPIWYPVKLVFMAWLVLPQFRGAAFIYERFVREQIKKYGFLRDHDHGHRSGNSTNGKGKKKFVQFIVPKKVVVDVDGRRSKRLTNRVKGKGRKPLVMAGGWSPVGGSWSDPSFFGGCKCLLFVQVYGFERFSDLFTYVVLTRK